MLASNVFSPRCFLFYWRKVVDKFTLISTLPLPFVYSIYVQVFCRFARKFIQRYIYGGFLCAGRNKVTCVVPRLDPTLTLTLTLSIPNPSPTLSLSLALTLSPTSALTLSPTLVLTPTLTLSLALFLTLSPTLTLFLTLTLTLTQTLTLTLTPPRWGAAQGWLEVGRGNPVIHSRLHRYL